MSLLVIETWETMDIMLLEKRPTYHVREEDPMELNIYEIVLSYMCIYISLQDETR